MAAWGRGQGTARAGAPGFGAGAGDLDPGRHGLSAHAPLPSWKGRALGGFLLLVALVCAGVSVYNAAHAAGLAGRHGTLTVENCWVEQGRRHSSDKTICSGVFRPADGSAPDREATLTRDLARGDTVEVQQTARGYLATGFGETWRWNALFFVGWIAAGIGVVFVASGIFPRRGQESAVTERIRGTRSAVAAKYLCLGGVAGVAVSLYLTWLF
ncbi:hypothetical protein [Streptomyces daliensis]|uniref:Uncharacterized protein n=1 Tax=Streptomyces daliensis TaxID=299421 RepID=A0A8T4ISC6_9ACTN|nr:hypothetical protein [Streptomyces daliensis]